MKIGISGGTGLIGKALVLALVKRGDTVVVFSRQKKIPPDLEGLGVEFISHPIPRVEDWEGMDAMVNLAGESLAGVRWSDVAKARFRYSRVDHTNQIVESMKESDFRPSVFLSASAIGFYGSKDSKNSVFHEGSTVGDGFLAMLCQDWERAAIAAEDLGVRVVIPRVGIVLDTRGGALAKLIPIFKVYMGGAIGTGQQGMSWIHMHDIVDGLLFLLDRNDLKGEFNLVSPQPVTNQVFSETLANVLNRPARLWTPTFIIEAMFGEGASIITEGQFVEPKKLLESGYHFNYKNLEIALQSLLEE